MSTHTGHYVFNAMGSMCASNAKYLREEYRSPIVYETSLEPVVHTGVARVASVAVSGSKFDVGGDIA